MSTKRHVAHAHVLASPRASDLIARACTSRHGLDTACAYHSHACIYFVSGSLESAVKFCSMSKLKKLAHRWSVGMSPFEERVRDVTSKDPHNASYNELREVSEQATRCACTDACMFACSDALEGPHAHARSHLDADTVIFVIEERARGADIPSNVPSHIYPHAFVSQTPSCSRLPMPTSTGRQ